MHVQKGAVWLLALAVLAGGAALAQRQNQTPRARRSAPTPRGGQNQSTGLPKLPDDPKLLELHKDFVIKAARLAKDYERNKEIEKARACYVEILKLIPGHPDAERMLANIREKEATAERKVLEVHANRDWQDTGVIVIPGKPVLIESAGTWTFKMIREMGPDGVKIPEELRDFNLGSLIAVVAGAKPDEAKPFFVGSKLEFVAQEPGRLLLRMYDSDVSDNTGKLSVEIHGTFDKD